MCHGLGTIGISLLVLIISSYQTVKRAPGDPSEDLPVLLYVMNWEPVGTVTSLLVPLTNYIYYFLLSDCDDGYWGQACKFTCAAVCHGLGASGFCNFVNGTPCVCRDGYEGDFCTSK